MDIDHDAPSNIVPFERRRPAPRPEAWCTVPVAGETASNDWEKGFLTGLRMSATGAARLAGGGRADEALALLRQIDARLKQLVG